jgi:oligopeptide/dipeptide ABC transporter ATP-binding protein
MTVLVEACHLKKYFPIRKGLLRTVCAHIKAVDNVSFSIQRGETLGLVGESGSGKSTIARLILRLIAATSGKVLIDGKDITTADRRTIKALRRKMGIVFQDPAASMNPRAPIRWTLKRVLAISGYDGPTIDAKVIEALHRVNLGKEILNRYPHQLSGGQQQRVSVARAMLLNPQLLIFDEPTSALDISVQAQVLNVLVKLQKASDLAFLFISHDLNVVRYISDRIAIMYLGRLMEIGPAAHVFQNAIHPYTRGLSCAAPPMSPHARQRKKMLLYDQPPSLINLPTGCPLHPRCPFTVKICTRERPELRALAKGHAAACHRAGEI